MKDFVFLENHTVYSMCEGTIFISELIQRAKAEGCRYVSICDTNGFYGLVRFINTCYGEGLKPLIGSRLKQKNFSSILLAKSMKGYSEICSLISRLKTDPSFNLRDNLLFSIPGDCTLITRDRELLNNHRKEAFAEINVLMQNYSQDYRFAKKEGIKPVLIHPVYFLRKEDFHLHKLLCAIHLRKTLSTLVPGEYQNENSFFPGIEDVCTSYSFMPDALENTLKIAEECSFVFEMGHPILPSFSPGSFGLLKSLCFKNLKKRYRKVTTEVINRLERELKIIRKKGYSDYFLIVHDLVKQSPYTCGRGSAAASLVSYLLFITHVDPIKHNLFFERFLNEARHDPPDIDVDFPWDTRDNILDYIFKKYGKEHTAMVSNHLTFSVRSSVREVARVYGIPENEIKKITKNIVYYYNREKDDFENLSVYRDGKPHFLKVYKDAVKIYGRPRHLSVHCGGVVITPQPVYHYIPIERAPKGVNIIQLEKDQAEELGLVKIDILGNRSLAVVRDTLELVEKHYGIKIPYQHFNPLKDKKTIDMLASGNTIGVFYVESPAMRQLQQKTGRGDYEHLVIHSSIIRPAANPYIREYIERLHGKPYLPLIPEMEDILKETYGIMCYQEDIIKIALRVAHFSLAEACELRKVISNKNKIPQKLRLKKLFYRNLLKRGVKRKTIDRIWDMIESFSGYSFCKPHSASFALLSFKACYLKAHYPAEFMGAVIKNGGGYYSTLAYISEARRMGIRVKPPEINQSRYQTFGKKDTIYLGFNHIKGLSDTIAREIQKEREQNGSYTGLLNFITRTGAHLSDTTLLIRADCFRKVEKYNHPQLLYLARVYLSSPYFSSGRFSRGRFSSRRKEKNSFSLPLPGVLSLITEKKSIPPLMKELSFNKRIKNELELFGFIVSIHPMSYWRQIIKRVNPLLSTKVFLSKSEHELTFLPDKSGFKESSFSDRVENELPPMILARDLGGFVGKKVRIAGILVTAKTVLTRTSELMQFVSFEDETAIFETIFFPEVYKKYAVLLDQEKPYILTGKVVEDFDAISLEVLQVESLSSKIKIKYKEETRNVRKICSKI